MSHRTLGGIAQPVGHDHGPGRVLRQPPAAVRGHVTFEPRTELVGIQRSHGGEFPIPLPPWTEQESIGAHLEEKLGELKRIVTGIESQIAMLTAYRKSLIHEGVTG